MVVELAVRGFNPATSPTKKSYSLRGRPQAAFSWRWNSNSKAVGGTQPTALPCCPIRAVFSDSIRWVVETGQ
jgi:hypothetical protein